MLWNFHGLTIEGQTNDSELRERWQASFASLPSASADSPGLRLELNIVAHIPPAPPGHAHFRQGDLLAYYLNGQTAIAHFPRFGQLTLELSNGATRGEIVSAALTTYGALEDLIAIGLAPHLRRRGLFLIHAFAAAITNHQLPITNNQALYGVLIVGSIGAGKTTTGMSLLDAGWKLLSNDSPIITAEGEILQYPGLLAAYPETFARFTATAQWADAQIQTTAGRQKLTVAAEAIWPDVWRERAPARAIVFPQIENRARRDAAHALEKLSPPEALRRLLPHAVEQWDTAMMPEHLRVLRLLVERAPAYLLRLGPEVGEIPAVLQAIRMTDD
jgi:hypothetical protein